MGQLTFPPSARVYLDTAPFIYSVEKHSDYWPVLNELWRSVRTGNITVVTSELTLLEVLVQPLRQDNKSLVSAYEKLLNETEIDLVAITTDILRSAANAGFEFIQSKLVRISAMLSIRWGGSRGDGSKQNA